MSKVYISSDYLFNRPEKKAKFEEFGEDVVAVDANWASVPEQKDGKDNLINAQASIRSRFSLGR
jgi:hypothetical protein